MNDFAASYSRVEEIVKACQSIRESLVCRVCLELFDEPVTIKCGHKFCKSCILQVASSENAACPFCNLKIQKRSIPRDGNGILKSCVNKYKALVEAILDDSGIDVTQPIDNKVKHTKESVEVNENLDTSRFEVASVASFSGVSLANQTIRSKVLSSNVSRNKSSRLSLRKPKQISNNLLKTPSSKNNNIRRYLENSVTKPHEVQSDEKVTNWLKNLTPEVNVSPTRESDCSDVTTSSKKNKVPSAENSPCMSLKGDQQAIFPKTYPSARKNKSVSSQSEAKNSFSQSTEVKADDADESHFKETQVRLQEAEIMAKKKKLVQTGSENLLKTPSSIPAMFHSDAGDWRRVKKVGKEMQVKTFKSLHVSVEKNSPPATMDESEPSYLGTVDGKNNLKDSDAKSTSHDPATLETKKNIKSTDVYVGKDSSLNVKQNSEQVSMDSTPMLQEENVTDSCTNGNKIENVTKRRTKTDSKLSLRIQNVSRATNPDSSSSLHNARADEDDQENGDFDAEPVNAKSTIDSNPPLKRKISLRLKTNDDTKSTPPKTSVKQFSISPPIPATPEKPRSKLSLRVSGRTSESSVNKSKIQTTVKTPVQSPVKSPVIISSIESRVKTPEKPAASPKNNNINFSRSSNLSTRRHVVFKKLGRISKKRNPIPFLYLGKIKPKEKAITCDPNQCPPGLYIKSVVSVGSTGYKKNGDQRKSTAPYQDVKMLSPEKDSQLKFLNLDSPNLQAKADKIVKSNLLLDSEQNKIGKTASEVIQTPKKNRSSRRQLDMDKEVAKSYEISKHRESEDDNKSYVSRSSAGTHNKTIIKIVNDKSDDDDEDDDVRAKVRSKKKNRIESMDDSDDESTTSSKKRIRLNPLRKRQPQPKKDDTRESERGHRQSTRSTRSSDSEFVRESSSKRTVNNSVNKVTDKILEDAANDSHNESERRKSVSASSVGSSIRRSATRKKRTHTESSNEEDDMSILLKWRPTNGEAPSVKKPKVTTTVAQIHSVINEENDSEDFDIDVVNVDGQGLAKLSLRNPIAGDEENIITQESVKQLQRDPPIDDIVKKFIAQKQEAVANKLCAIPSSLGSADMFDTNDQSIIQSSVPSVRKKSVGGRASSSNRSSPSDKENLVVSQEPDVTVIDKPHFQKAHTIEAENLNKSNDDEPSRIEKIQDYVNGSFGNNLMNDEEIVMKLEKDKIGIDTSIPGSPKTQDKFVTPPGKKQPSQLDSEFDTENIDATPVVRKRNLFNVPMIKPKIESSLSSPESNPNVIPAFTPMRNTRSYPLNHSTPMNRLSTIKEATLAKNVVIACSGLSVDHNKYVSEFLKRFKVKFKSNFSIDVTHVVVNTNPVTKCGQKTSKYVQGIAFKKYVINIQWIIDCLSRNTLLDENDEMYEVLDPDTLENGSKRSRDQPANLFKGFAFYCLEPFTSLPVDDFKKILQFNGAVVTDSPNELSLQKDKNRVVLLESEDLKKSQIALLKKNTAAILLSFEWVIDSISQYFLLSIVPYLYETSVDEALESGISKDLLVFEDAAEEDNA
ncbi:breast cancer type 1 susceptibility protein homolog [Copidosoma floridanum]|uniref:breast cancer type 1 susceptibility protein homolog n=1 Tax=Copidosoma floridanum TaxID=29053 RepID=UPI0006C9446E|nr:breast cancer type 1 susceptibility protein homolog [Copidosoma floridanum]